jgi:hypothetical protein
VASLSSINFKIGADLKDFRSSIRNIDRSLSNMSRGFGALGATIGAAFVVDRIASFGKEASELAGKAEGVENAFRRFADPTLLNDLRTATRGTASDLELMTSAVKAQQFGIPMKEMTRLLEFASRRAQETGESIDYMLNSVIVGIGRKSPKILDNLGISASRLSKEFNGAAVEAQSIGDVTRVVAKIAEEEMGKAGAAFTSTGDKTAAFAASVQNLQIAIGERLNKVMGPAAGFMTEFANAAANYLSEPFSSKLEEEAVAVGGLIIELESANTSSERKGEIIAMLQTKYPGYLENIDAEKTSSEELKKATIALNDELVNRIVIMKQQEAIDAAAEKKAQAAINVAEKRLEVAARLNQMEQEYNHGLDFTNMTLEERILALRNWYNAEVKAGRIRGVGAAGSFSLAGRLNTQYKILTGAETELQRADAELNEQFNSKNEVLKELGINAEEYNNTLEITKGGTGETAEETKELTDEEKKRIETLKEYERVLGNVNREVKEMNEGLINTTLEIGAGQKDMNAWSVSLSEGSDEMARFYGHLDKTRAAFEGMQPILDETEELFVAIPKTALNMFDYMRLSIDGVSNSLQTLFVASIQNGESFMKNLMNMLKALTVKLLAAAAAAAILAALITIITGGTGLALTAGGATLSGGALVGGLFKGMMGIPMLASGGIVTGPTLAMVGEGGGPEAVIPLDRLNSFMGGGNINVTGRIQGQDILLSQERASRTRSRYRGF